MRHGTSLVGHPVDVATGIVYSTHRDAFVAGRMALTWDRRYSGALLQSSEASPLGAGWTVPYLASLARDDIGFVMVTPEGGREAFPDPLNTVDAGGLVRNLSTFQELRREGSRYVVTRWSPDGPLVVRLVFEAGRRRGTWRLSSVEDPGGQGLDLFYDRDDRLQRIRQRLEQRALLLHYDNTGSRITSLSMVTPDDRRQQLVAFEYDHRGRLAAAVDALGAADRFEYDTSSRLVRETSKDGAVFVFRYDAQGRCVWTSGPDGYDEKALRYYDAIRWTEVTNSVGDTTRYEWTALGQVTRIVYPDGAATRTEYDDRGRVVSEIDGTGATTRFGYDDEGNRSTIVDPLGNTYAISFNSAHLPLTVTLPTGAIWARRYDSSNRVIATTDPMGAVWETAYDRLGNPVEIRSPTGATKRQSFSAHGVLIDATDWRGATSSYTFDDFGRVIERRSPSGGSVRVRFDAIGRVLEITYSDRVRLVYTYDRAGNPTSIVDADGHTSRYRWGPCRRMIERTDAAGGTIRLRWGTEPGVLQEVVNEVGESHRYTHDALGRVTQETAFDGRELRYAYDLAGRVVAITNPCGETIGLVRNANGHIVEQRLPDGSRVSYEYDAINNLTGAVNADGALIFERNALGQVIREVQGDHAVETTLDLLGHVTRLATDLDYEAQYERDENGLLVRVKVQPTHAIEFVRDRAGRERQRIFSGGLWIDHDWDDLDNPVRQAVGVGSERATLARTYAFDGRRELLSVEDAQSGRTEYTYDQARRLRAALRERGVSEHYTYDAAGNLTTVRTVGSADQGETSQVLAYGAGNRLLRKGGTEYVYDANGRLVRKMEQGGAAWQYTWDVLDRLRSVRAPSGDEWRYTYDPLGRRIAKEGPRERVRYVWAGDTVVHALTGESQRETWIFPPGGYTPLAKFEAGRMYAVVSDVSGTPREMFSTFGDRVWVGGPPSWGGPDHPQGTVDCPFRFAGQWYDAESDLCYSRFRYYDPTAARFISPDPIGLAGGLHSYAYGPNPIGWIDPWGWNFFRGARPGEAPSFDPRPTEFKVRDGQVQPTHGVSVFDNPGSVSGKGFVPHEIDPASVPDSLQIIQRGKDPKHFEIVPVAPMTEAEYRAALAQIKTTPPSPPGGDGADDDKPKQEGCD